LLMQSMFSSSVDSIGLSAAQVPNATAASLCLFAQIPNLILGEQEGKAKSEELRAKSNTGLLDRNFLNIRQK
jgi:hypothetical protein